MTWGNRVALGVLLAGLAGTWYARHREQLLHTRPKYTIGTLTGSATTPKSGRHYNYRFSVHKQLYYGSGSYEPAMSTEVGSRFLVEYDSLDPEVSVGHFAVPIPDSLPAAPTTGWRRPPFPVPAQYLPARPESRP